MALKSLVDAVLDAVSTIFCVLVQYQMMFGLSLLA